MQLIEKYKGDQLPWGMTPQFGTRKTRPVQQLLHNVQILMM